MSHDSALLDSLNTITSYIKTIEADMPLLLISSSPSNEKIDADIAGFMRSSLHMYTSIEASQILLQHACSMKCQEAVSHTLHHAKSLSEKHVAQLPTTLLLTERIEMLQQHLVLLQRTLATILEEMQNLSRPPGDPNQLKRQKIDF